MFTSFDALFSVTILGGPGFLGVSVAIGLCYMDLAPRHFKMTVEKFGRDSEPAIGRLKPRRGGKAVLN
ncbi:hypothetical protein V6N13_009040 [Hibiscus sabdariffa]|uniref:Uncharacterized protein n=1 Tax=Hibiscus sabdariffa TaxID=183260 RepID=A0ABR2AF15_9ROSI